MIFLTVGTQFPFDRLVKAVDDLLDGDLVNEKIFAQIGDSSYRPRNFKVVSSLEKRFFAFEIGFDWVCLGLYWLWVLALYWL